MLKKITFMLLFSILISNTLFAVNPVENKKKTFGIVIHGGAGTIKKANMTQEKEDAVRKKLQEALDTGYSMLEKGECSLDVVEKVINILEDSPLFNAGKGAVFANNEKNELDASIMDGKTLNAGAIAGVHHVKNPISLAKIVMDNSKHVMLSGKGAEEFAMGQNIEMVDDNYFYTEKRFEQLKKAKNSELEKEKHGTVGAVVLDMHGNLAAGTSTGGMTNKKFGRIGDSPVIGAGTYANNNTCAVSSTGHGEYFIRSVLAYDISANMEYGKLTLTEAADKVIHTKLTELGGTGGIIAIDKNGNFAMTFNTAGMYRGVRTSENTNKVEIYK